jgi:hypothetical protein
MWAMIADKVVEEEEIMETQHLSYVLLQENEDSKNERLFISNSRDLVELLV